MKRLSLLSLALAAACAHGSSGSAPSGVANRIKHAVPEVVVVAGLEGSSVPQVFEQTFCSALFDLNDKQVTCSDDMRAFVRIQKEKALLGAQAVSAQETEQILDAPRKVELKAEPANGKIALAVTVQDDKGTVLLRFVEELDAQGGDLSEKARDAAKRVAYLP